MSVNPEAFFDESAAFYERYKDILPEKSGQVIGALDKKTDEFRPSLAFDARQEMSGVYLWERTWNTSNADGILLRHVITQVEVGREEITGRCYQFRQPGLLFLGSHNLDDSAIAEQCAEIELLAGGHLVLAEAAKLRERKAQLQALLDSGDKGIDRKKIEPLITTMGFVALRTFRPLSFMQVEPQALRADGQYSTTN